jgi:predicted phosphate transport protein (TIGR00153 family)
MERIWPEVLELSSDLQKAVSLLHEAYSQMSRGDCPGARTKSGALNELESAADAKLKRIERQLISSDLFPTIRQYILEAVRLLDDAIDRSMEASRMLCYRPLSREEIDELRVGLEPSLDGLFSLLLKITDETRRMLQLIVGDFAAARKQAETVEDTEEEIDRVKLKLIEELYKREDRLKPLSIIQLEKVILAADDVADTCEDISDALVNIANIANP